ncbi:hypothetical protein FEM48_Zijuj10G0098000 [Ziziphus jujuba var. spinosa]|uniref:MADS-box domain-containing protein n=1 Tax=Ziziphus jujuba var. spinosa TaxID=714518 RepID=A0A978UMN9_ZIZJJ|nr:hypothetical protein FEM48_Zijuj10G0098000 [Ziziphus jujuba var. spinosa]
MASSTSEKNRKATLKKKASELSILCGVDVFMVIFGSDGSMEVWPDDSAKANSTLSKYCHAINKLKPINQNNNLNNLSNSDQLHFPSDKKMELLQTDGTTSN